MGFANRDTIPIPCFDPGDHYRYSLEIVAIEGASKLFKLRTEGSLTDAESIVYAHSYCEIAQLPEVPTRALAINKLQSKLKKTQEGITSGVYSCAIEMLLGIPYQPTQ